MKTDIIYCENNKCPLRCNCLRFKEKSEVSEEYLFWWDIGAYDKKNKFLLFTKTKI
jgi:hypothetical protein